MLFYLLVTALTAQNPSTCDCPRQCIRWDWGNWLSICTWQLSSNTGSISAELRVQKYYMVYSLVSKSQYTKHFSLYMLHTLHQSPYPCINLPFYLFSFYSLIFLFFFIYIYLYCYFPYPYKRQTKNLIWMPVVCSSIKT